MQNWIALAFADGVYTFRLGLTQINEIESKCGAGLGEVFARLLKGRYEFGDEVIHAPADATWKVRDLIEVIRQGLIGGMSTPAIVDGIETKVTALRINELIESYVLGRPLADAWLLATAILSALIRGYEPKKAEAPGKGGVRSRKRASSDPTGTPGPSPTAS